MDYVEIFIQAIVAEREGFEPSVEILSLRRFSKPLPSATRPPLHVTTVRDRAASTAEIVARAGHHRRGGILPQLKGEAQGMIRIRIWFNRAGTFSRPSHGGVPNR